MEDGFFFCPRVINLAKRKPAIIVHMQSKPAWKLRRDTLCLEALNSAARRSPGFPCQWTSCQESAIFFEQKETLTAPLVKSLYMSKVHDFQYEAKTRNILGRRNSRDGLRSKQQLGTFGLSPTKVLLQSPRRISVWTPHRLPISRRLRS